MDETFVGSNLIPVNNINVIYYQYINFKSGLEKPLTCGNHVPKIAFCPVL